MEKANKKKKVNPHDGHRDRVREKYLNSGNLDGFEEHEVIEFLLFYCYPRINTNEIAHRMINEFGSLAQLVEARPHEISKRCGVNLRVATIVSLVSHLSRVYLTGKYQPKEKMHNTKLVGDYCLSLFTNIRYECFYIICLDTGRRLLRAELIHEGGMDSAAIYPRLIVEAALKNQAACVVLAHNHPGGTYMPSKNDIGVTKRLRAALETVDIQLADHVIIADSKYYSFIEKKIHF